LTQIVDDWVLTIFERASKLGRVSYQPPQDPWHGQAPPPPPPPDQPPTAQFGAVPPYPTAPFPPAQAGQRSWLRKLPRPTQILLAAASVLALLCCGGAAIGALTDPPSNDKQTAPTSPRDGANAPAPGAADLASPSAVPTEATTQPAPSQPPSPVVETRTVTEKQNIPYATRTVKDSSLPEGTRKVRTRGIAGVKTLTYQVTITDGVQTSKKLVRSVVTKAPVTQVVVVGTKQTKQCDPNYSGACVPIASDVDCAGGSGNGPAYVDGPVRVIGTDVYDLDRDGDGIACDD
jgi:resuscitation-promoting factor RpfB